MTSQTISASRLAGGLIAVGFAGALALASGAAAQTLNANSASYNAGFGRTAGEENRPVNVQLTDSNGNTTLVNGLIQSTAAGSIFGEVTGVVSASASASGSASGGASSSFSGAGGGSSSSAIGNNLNVVVQGDNNTVIVNSTQNNTGAVTATSTTNGK